jgi:C_GCAxxG_C_C family probable redox protein
VLAVGGHMLGLVSGEMRRAACAFAGGVGGSKQGMCGALSGGVIVIGSLYGRANLEEDERLARNLAARYLEQFRAAFGSVNCAQVYERVHAPGASGSCTHVVEESAAILLDLLTSA